AETLARFTDAHQLVFAESRRQERFNLGTQRSPGIMRVRIQEAIVPDHLKLARIEGQLAGEFRLRFDALRSGERGIVYLLNRQVVADAAVVQESQTAARVVE